MPLSMDRTDHLPEDGIFICPYLPRRDMTSGQTPIQHADLSDCSPLPKALEFEGPHEPNRRESIAGAAGAPGNKRPQDIHPAAHPHRGRGSGARFRTTAKESTATPRD